MIRGFRNCCDHLIEINLDNPKSLSDDLLWIDLIHPTIDEKKENRTLVKN
ncbi:hypothetical protein MEG_00925 [Bartonella tamiae Th307]|uniref:Uncharacterized protein n=1 Tax=Bartonella tamiae Th239 TaxID=1094558 RepID=J1K0K4_9HYPH|nr:hypothetical protein ME5_00956 [Bartonella tamiae Th239]EJF94067.1 hypothetical protein MEG_00925 [Bartonella tamiae Th307]